MAARAVHQMCLPHSRSDLAGISRLMTAHSDHETIAREELEKGVHAKSIAGAMVAHARADPTRARNSLAQMPDSVIRAFVEETALEPELIHALPHEAHHYWEALIPRTDRQRDVVNMFRSMSNEFA